MRTGHEYDITPPAGSQGEVHVSQSNNAPKLYIEAGDKRKVVELSPDPMKLPREDVITLISGKKEISFLAGDFQDAARKHDSHDALKSKPGATLLAEYATAMSNSPTPPNFFEFAKKLEQQTPPDTKPHPPHTKLEKLENKAKVLGAGILLGKEYYEQWKANHPKPVPKEGAQLQYGGECKLSDVKSQSLPACSADGVNLKR